MTRAMLLLTYKPKSNVFWYLPATIVAITILLFENFLPSGPDANLYFGLSRNLVDGTGYIDNIRNDFILPPVGHPLLIVVLSFFKLTGVGINFLLLFLSLICAFGFFKNRGFSLVVSLLLIFLIPFLLPPFNIYGVEVSLVFSVSLMFFVFSNFFIKRTMLWGVLLGLSIALFILIRPLLLPAIVLAIPVAVIVVVYRKSLFRLLWPVFATVAVIYGVVLGISKMQYGDSRFTSGTYSGITLYCAFNEYIYLETTYESENWNELSPQRKSEGVLPLQIASGGTWQDRDAVLKSKEKEFILQHPGRALHAYLWRLGKYSFRAEGNTYRLLLYLWIATSLFLMYKWVKTKIQFVQKWQILFILIFPLYIIGIQAVFVYAGNRYYVVPVMAMIFCITMGVTLFQKKT
ncbi:MAG: hypothetical protein CVU11_12000 [Bacteroidetes bacterium HGW-Bacteroidetes-6]|nr:MAG: hypothetical protein CVU11_12000 [Bacteroidetes bacterium HGW-Bacteroidetes-6]